jgi:hypothetical protein
VIGSQQTFHGFVLFRASLSADAPGMHLGRRTKRDDTKLAEPARASTAWDGVVRTAPGPVALIRAERAAEAAGSSRAA